MSASIQVANLHKSFGGQQVLQGVSARVASGETLAVLGRSGTGKSVLLKLIIGLQSPDSGSIQIGGKEVTGMPANELYEVRKRVGFLFQQAALYDSLTVLENVTFPLSRHAQLPPSEVGGRARELLDCVGIGNGNLGKFPSQISGGMQKRVGLARALALDPEIILLDEPTAGLDPITATEICKLILSLKQRRQMAGIVVTHDVLTTQIFADRVLILHQGAILVEGSFAELARSRDPVVAGFLSPGKE